MKIDLKELAEEGKRNAEQRLKFVKFWVDYMRKSSNKKWSSEQKEFIDALYQNHEQWRKLKI